MPRSAAAAEEIAPRYVWSKRGYAPTGGALAVWTRPVPMWIDPATGKKATKDTPEPKERRVFRIEQTYRAAEVINEVGQTGSGRVRRARSAEGEARQVFERHRRVDHRPRAGALSAAAATWPRAATPCMPPA
jgi:hypothetical protein